MLKPREAILNALSVEPQKSCVVGYWLTEKYTAEELALMAGIDVKKVYGHLSALKKSGHNIKTVKHTREVYESGNVEYFIEPKQNKGHSMQKKKTAVSVLSEAHDSACKALETIELTLSERDFEHNEATFNKIKLTIGLWRTCQNGRK